MIVQLMGTHLELTDERYAFVMDELESCFQLMKRMGCGPIHVDVELEKRVEHAPQTRRGQRLYRAGVEVTVPDGVIRVEGGADDLQQAVLRMKERLAEKVRSRQETGDRTRQPKTRNRSEKSLQVAR